MHPAVLRRAHVDALELVLGRDLALDQLGPILPRISASSLPTSVRRSWSICMIFSSISAILPLAWAIEAISCAALAVQARRVALQRGHAVERHQVLLPQAADAAQLLLVPVDLRGLGRHLLVVADDLLAELVDLLEELRLLALARRAAELEQPLLARRRSAPLPVRCGERGARPGR